MSGLAKTSSSTKFGQMAESVQFALQLRPASSNIHQVVKALCLGSSTRPPQSLYGVGSNPTLLKLFLLLFGGWGMWCQESMTL
jgi:hypothetical protein